jgi:hypothetical protein
MSASGSCGDRSIKVSRFVAALVVAGAQAVDAGAQSFFTEVDVTVGHSTEDVQAAGTQVRVFGEGPKKWRLFAEATWADVWGPTSDAFGAAYPYNNKVRPMEVFAEKTMTGRRMLLGGRLGRYRTPFGIYNRSDHGYTGFLRAPLIRYGGYWALSNNFLETGASVVAGIPRLQAEVSLGIPQDEDIQRRRRGFDRVARVQSAFGPWIVGGSYIFTTPSESRSFATGDTEFLGLDARWMSGGVQVRGEWIDGRSFAGTRTYGGYADVIVHRPFMGPVTAVARVEKLDYLAGRFSSFPRRYTTGARLRLASMLVAHVNAVHEPAYDQQRPSTALDVALTFTARR